ncbi:uncharacterized protein [Atheta coriaria]|uniref:uncharacterized protein n=1 Tax=Dalotia coriaria TaxID=877792 RepID=UPI0031F4755B
MAEQSCPQCRHKETPTTIHRIYLNIASSEGIAEDVATLQARLDTVKFEISVKEQNLMDYASKYKRCKAKCVMLKESIVEMEQEQRTHETNMLALQTQLKSYQERARDKDKLVVEIEQLKKQIDSMDHLKTMLTNCDQQSNLILNQNNDANSLAILSGTLKSQLEATKQKNKDMSSQIYRIGKEMLHTNSITAKLRSRCQLMEPGSCGNCTSEINYLTGKINQMRRRSSGGSTPNCTRTSGSTSVLDYSDVMVYEVDSPQRPSKSMDPIVILSDVSPDSTSPESATRNTAKSSASGTPMIGKGVKRAKSSMSTTSTRKLRRLSPRNAKKAQ